MTAMWTLHLFLRGREKPLSPGTAARKHERHTGVMPGGI